MAREHPTRASEALHRQFGVLYEQIARRKAVGFNIEFYPYARLSNTIRFRKGLVLVRISDLLQDAPLEILDIVLKTLVYKLCRKRVPEELKQIYREYTDRPELLSRARAIRRRRGRKEIRPAAGKNFDLRKIFEELNREYFDSPVQIRQLGWSSGRSRRILGHYDPAHEAIVLNRRLDHPLVPGYVVAYVLYHEMLHVQVGSESRNGRRRHHSARFREAESRFAELKLARDFIERHL